MKNKFKSFSILILSLAFILIMSITAFAKTLQQKRGDAHKTWTIKFNKEIDISTVKDNITVEDSKGNLVNATIEVSGTVARVKPPIGGYELGEYTIKVSHKIKSATGKSMKDSYEMKFDVIYTKAVTDPNLIVNSESGMEYITWIQEYDINKNKYIEYDIDNDGIKEGISIGMDTPNGTKVVIIKGDKGYNLMYDASIGSNTNLFDDYGGLKEGYLLQICFFDFDNDGIKEIIIADGDKLINLGVSIIKYDSNKKANPFYEIGYIEGQKKIIITKDKKIEVPYASQGLFTIYKYVDNKFEEEL